MGVQHDRDGIGVGLVEDLPEDEDDELHRGEVVVVQEHLVEARPLELRLRLRLGLGQADAGVFFAPRAHRASALKMGDCAT